MNSTKGPRGRVGGERPGESCGVESAPACEGGLAEGSRALAAPELAAKGGPSIHRHSRAHAAGGKRDPRPLTPILIAFCSVLPLSLASAQLGSCSAGGDGSPGWRADSTGPSQGVTLETRAKPRDVSAAVSRSMPVVELAVLEERPIEAGGREFTLVGAQGEEGVLRVEFAEGSSQEFAWRREMVDMRLTAQIGLFGNGARERALVDQLNKELGALGKQP